MTKEGIILEDDHDIEGTLRPLHYVFQHRVAANSCEACPSEKECTSGQRPLAFPDPSDPFWNKESVHDCWRACFQPSRKSEDKVACALPPSSIRMKPHAGDHKGEIRKSGDLSEQKRHVKDCHPAVYAAIEAAEQKRKGEGVKVARDFVRRSEATIRGQGSIVAHINRMKSGKSERAIREMFARAALLAESGIPHNAFEGEFFDQWIRSVRALQTHETFMSTRTVTDTALPILDKLLYRDAVADLHHAKAVCAVTDGWTSADGLFWRGVMFHWVGEDLTLHVHGSDFFHITSRVAEAEGLQLNEVIQRTLSQDQVVGYCVTDGAERRMCEEVPVDNWWCVDHRLHNVVVNARKNGASGGLYDYVQWLCSLICRTHSLSSELERRRKGGGHSRLGALTPSETRWNSLLLSADRLLELWDNLVGMAKDNLFVGHLPPEDRKHPDKVRLEPGEWFTSTNRDTLFECQRVLRVFADASTELEGEGYPTLSLVPKWIDRIFANPEPSKQLARNTYVGSCCARWTTTSLGFSTNQVRR